jgi:hypothetical protein
VKVLDFHVCCNRHSSFLGFFGSTAGALKMIGALNIIGLMLKESTGSDGKGTV